MVIEEDIQQLTGVDKQRIEFKTSQYVAGTFLQRNNMIFIKCCQ